MIKILKLTCKILIGLCLISTLMAVYYRVFVEMVEPLSNRIMYCSFATIIWTFFAAIFISILEDKPSPV
jgi:vacuolar-type H+-ATPase subunit I/STV1